VNYLPGRVSAPSPQIAKREGGAAAHTVRLRSGRYVAWLQGSFGPGVRLYIDGRPSGDVVQDLGLPDGWFRLGEFRARRETTFVLLGLERSRLLAGSEHSELVGPLVVARAAEPRVESVQPNDLDRFCGREVDWIELPPAGTPADSR
jgi:hypothetical protein